MKRLCILMSCVALGVAETPAATAAATLSYDVSIVSVSPPMVSVWLRCSAPTGATGPMELVFPRSADGRARRLVPYCSQLSATGPAGEALDATFAYEIDGVRVAKPARSFTLAYTVVLVHGYSRYSGMTLAEAPVLNASGGVFPARVLMLLPAGMDNPPVELRLHLPAGWNAVAPWETRQQGDVCTATLPFREAVDSFFYMGPETGITTRLGDGELTVVAAAELADVSRQQLEAWTGAIMAGQHAIFGCAPSPRTVVYLSSSSLPAGMYAAALRDSAHLVLPNPNATASLSRATLLRGMARGLVHLWVGGVSAMPNDPGLFFFESGLAEYTAMLSLMQAHLLTEKDFLAYLQGAMEDYLGNPLAGEVSVLEGAQSPALADAPEGLKQFATLLSRSGGNLAGFVLDGSLLAESGLERNLNSFWAAHLARFKSRQDYGREPYRALWKQVSPQSDVLAPFLRAPLELEPALAAVGVRVVASTLEEPFLGVFFDTRSATAEIKAVMPGPGRDAGLRRGDVILKMGPMPIPDANVLFFKLNNAHPGEVISLRVRSAGGTERDVPVRLQARTVRTLERIANPTRQQERLWRAMIRAQ